MFAPAQLITEARSAGSTYPDTTLRTFIVGPMCLNSPDHHAVQYDDLERVARGLLRLSKVRRRSLAFDLRTLRQPKTRTG